MYAETIYVNGKVYTMEADSAAYTCSSEYYDRIKQGIMYKYKVLMTDTCFPDTDIEEKVLNEADAKLVIADSTEEDVLISEGADCDGVIFDFAKLTERVLSSWRKCKVVSRVGIGVDGIDLKAASKNGIMVANVPDYCLDEVADHAATLYLAVHRGLPMFDRNIRSGKWDVKSGGLIRRMSGSNFGIYGFGRIGQRIAKRMQAFGFNIYAYDPYLKSAVFDDFGAIKVNTLNELAEISDGVALAVSLTSETKGAIGEEFFKHMREGAVIVNTSRGQVIDEKALIASIESGKLRGAGLDVFETEPLPENSKLRNFDNVILTPHTAFYSVESELELRRKCALEVVCGLKDGAPRSFVNKSMIHLCR